MKQYKNDNIVNFVQLLENSSWTSWIPLAMLHNAIGRGIMILDFWVQIAWNLFLV